jgi:hypothetical protein
MTILKLALVASASILLTACANPGPMQLGSGPTYTPVFEPVALDLTDNRTGNVLFKETAVFMYLDDKRESALLGGGATFFITNTGAYLADWNTNTYKYSIEYQVSAKDIKNLSEFTVVRDYLPDSNLIRITDNKNQTVGFSVRNRVAAKQALISIMPPQ